MHVAPLAVGAPAHRPLPDAPGVWDREVVRLEALLTSGIATSLTKVVLRRRISDLRTAAALRARPGTGGR